MSLKETILATPFLREKKLVEKPTWPGLDGKLYVRNLNALEAERYLELLRRPREGATTCLAAEVVVLVTVDEHGKAVFDNPDDDIKRLSQGDEAPLDTIFEAFNKLRASGGDPAKKSETASSPPSST